jgi:hypothetical protein
MLQIVSIAAGLVAATVLCCSGAMISAALTERPADLQPGDTLTVKTHPVGWVLYGLGVAALIGGFVGVWIIARREARLRGEPVEAGRPRLTWRTIISPRGLSRLLFTPKGVYPVDDALMGRLGFARSLLAIAILVIVVAAYDVGSVSLLASQFVAQGLNALIVGSVVFALCGVVLAAVSDLDQRPTAWRAIRRPAITLAYTWLLAVAFLLYVSKVLEPWGDAINSREMESFSDVIVGVIYVIHVAWVVAFFCFSLIYIGRFLFNGSDAHPGLPAVTSIALSWTFIGLSFLASATGPLPVLFGDADLPVPGTVSQILSLSGAVTVTILAVVELIRLRRMGVGLRAGPWR